MDGEYKSECEECDNITVVLNVDSFDQPCFCSICEENLTPNLCLMNEKLIVFL